MPVYTQSLDQFFLYYSSPIQYNDPPNVESSCVVLYERKIKKCSSWDCTGNTTVNWRLDVVKIVAMRKTACLETVLESSEFWEEAVRMELTPY